MSGDINPQPDRISLPPDEAHATVTPHAELMAIAHRLRDHYKLEDSPLNHRMEYMLPSRQETLAALSELSDLLFPDHRLDGRIRDGGEAIERLVASVHRRLCRQVYLALAHDRRAQPPCPVTLEQAERATLAFMERLPELRTMLALDVQAAMNGDPAARSFDEIIFCYPGFEAVATYRIAHELHRLKVPLLPRMMTEHAHTRTGSDIHPGASIGRSFFIDHATGVVIGETTIIGDRVKLYQGVTLGALSIPTDSRGQLLRGVKRHPTIEADVVIYAGATVLGGRTVIGHGSVIGGSCWVTRSVPPGTRVTIQDPQMAYRTARDTRPGFVEDWVI